MAIDFFSRKAEDRALQKKPKLFLPKVGATSLALSKDKSDWLALSVVSV